jgi:glycerol kinase
MKRAILAIDSGTTGNRAMAYSREGDIIANAYQTFRQHYPSTGWVEHDPQEIWRTTQQVVKAVLREVGGQKIDSIGITNQRETTVLWDRDTKEPVYNAIVWQDGRTRTLCDQLVDSEKRIKEKTGLFLFPYFSATKIRWILDNVAAARDSLRRGTLLFGTIDTWLLWKLTGGKVHATEPGNASRTLCYDIRDGRFDPELLDIFELPEGIFPEVKESAGVFGVSTKEAIGYEIPITGILGDQQASLFAHGGCREDVLKSTYGTGIFLLAKTGAQIIDSDCLVSAVCWRINGKTSYGLEGSVFIGGASLQWLKEGIHLIDDYDEIESLTEELKSNEDVYFVPALTGLGAPHWDSSARGIVIGLTRGTRAAHLVRAAVESMAYQSMDVVTEMEKALQGKTYDELRVDGGSARSDFLLQFQADILGRPVERAASLEMTALGAAGIAGTTTRFWDEDAFSGIMRTGRRFEPAMGQNERARCVLKWKRAVERSRHWSS